MIQRTAYLAFAIQDISTAGRYEGERVDCTRCGLRALYVSQYARHAVVEWIRNHICDEAAARSPWLDDELP